MSREFLDWTIQAIVSRFPETRDVFIQNGFEIFSGDEVLQNAGAILHLKIALQLKKINAEAFLKLIDDRIENVARETRLLSLMQSAKIDTSGTAFRFVAHIPRPLQVTLQEELKLFLQTLQEKRQVWFNYSTGPFFLDEELSFHDCMGYEKDVDAMPDIVLAHGFGLFNEKMIKRVVAQGVYRAFPWQPANKIMTNSGAIDVDGQFVMIAASATVMVVDCNKLHGLPVPQTWGDLLKPEYERMVVLTGHNNHINELVLLYIYKQYGTKGIAALGRSVRQYAQPPQMIKAMASNNEVSPPIYVMSNFFANMLPQREQIKVIWPQDGALIMPIFILVKANKKEAYKELVDFLTGIEIGRIFAGSNFLSAHPDVDNHLPEGASLQWIGWDFIKKNDISSLTKKLNEKFWESHRGTAF